MALFAAHDCYSADEVHGWSGNDASAGEHGTATRHQFVDQRTRGEHQSCVVE
ncbi:MAG: hypothetical protein ABEI27_10170 [Halobellus sp.]|uniref:hypothetical protein n=1 Tax=Halobellus sp. TaxID=1979212 RepID=UPI0035D4A4F0